MSDREDEIRRVMAELDVHIAEVEASVAALKALLADDEVLGKDALDIRMRIDASASDNSPAGARARCG
jgi:hypothetical protein